MMPRKLFFVISFFLFSFFFSCLKRTEIYLSDENIIGKIHSKDSSGQIILVTAGGLGTYKGYLQAFEKQQNGEWVSVFPAISALIGRNGFNENKKEGDGCSPIGAFPLGQAYGNKENPGLKISYQKTDTNDFWVDDSNSTFYNMWMRGPASGRWNSAEALNSYDYSVVIKYNTEREKGKGSAIFFHTWDKTDVGTFGCIGVPTPDFIKILKWLDPEKKPLIIMGTKDEILKY